MGTFKRTDPVGLTWESVVVTGPAGPVGKGVSHGLSRDETVEVAKRAARRHPGSVLQLVGRRPDDWGAEGLQVWSNEAGAVRVVRPKGERLSVVPPPSRGAAESRV
jgi:hypothetical protein